MAKQKGSPKTGGRQKGSENRTTVEFKEALNKLLLHAAPKMVGWLDQIAQDDPHKALGHISNLAEYIQPKLARTELTGKDGGAIEHKDTTPMSEVDKQILAEYQSKLKESTK